LQSGNRIYRKEVQVLGPVPAPLSRIKKQYRWQLLLKGLKVGPLHSLCTALMARAEKEMSKAGVRIVVDVDPTDML